MRDQLLQAYEALGVSAGKVVIAVGNFGRLMLNGKKEEVLATHFDALLHLLGTTGTLVVPTASTHLVGTDTVFDPATTPARSVGPFSDFVRMQPSALRSMHPYVSYAAYGKHAKDITQYVSRHAFGPETPEARLIELDALHVGVGMPLRITQATSHHIEMLMGVPYRYVREYLHPVLRGSVVRVEPFYMLVTYDAAGVKRDYNRKIFSNFERSNRGNIRRIPVGRSEMGSYCMRDFFEVGIQSFKNDLYIWTESQAANPEIYRRRV